MKLAEFVLVHSVIEGPMQLTGEDRYTLVCYIETQDGKKAVDEIKGEFSECYDLKEAIILLGPQMIEATWTEDASNL